MTINTNLILVFGAICLLILVSILTYSLFKRNSNKKRIKDPLPYSRDEAFFRRNPPPLLPSKNKRSREQTNSDLADLMLLNEYVNSSSSYINHSSTHNSFLHGTHSTSSDDSNSSYDDSY